MTDCTRERDIDRELMRLADDGCPHTPDHHSLTLDHYQRDAMRTCTHERGGAGSDALAWNSLGITGEAGEVADMVKKHVAHGHTLDRVKLAGELGDVLWYVAALAHCIGYDLSTLAAMNTDKLRRRYPHGFTQADSINRHN